MKPINEILNLSYPLNFECLSEVPAALSKKAPYTYEILNFYENPIAVVYCNLTSEFEDALHCKKSRTDPDRIDLIGANGTVLELCDKEREDYESRLGALIQVMNFNSADDVPPYPTKELVNSTLRWNPVLLTIARDTLSFDPGDINSRETLKLPIHICALYEDIAEIAGLSVEDVLLELIDPMNIALLNSVGVDVSLSHYGLDYFLCGDAKHLRERGKIVPIGYLPERSESDPDIDPIEVDTFVYVDGRVV